MLLRFLSYGNISPYFSIANSLFGNNNPYKILRNRRCSRMLIILIRTIVLYFIILFVMRVMGKAELSKMSPFQMIVSFMIAELAAMPIESPDISMISGVTAIFTLLFLQVLISLLSIKSERLKNLFSGSPSILIEKGKINKKEMKRLRLTISDLLEALRIGGSPSLSSVEYAVMESNGNLSIIQKAQEKPLTPADLSIAKSPESMPLVLISDGNFYPQNLQASGWTETQMDSELLARGVTSRSEVFFAFCDEQSRLHVFLTDSSDVFATEVSR
mgnify:FL=1